MYGLSADESILHKICRNSLNTYSLVYLALLLDSGFGQALTVITLNWPFFARQSTEFMGTGTLVCVPITAPGCSSQNMLLSSLGACGQGQSSRHQAKGHQNPRKYHVASLCPSVTRGFCDFFCSPLVFAILHHQRKQTLGAARKKFSGKLKTLITDHVCPYAERSQ